MSGRNACVSLGDFQVPLLEESEALQKCIEQHKALFGQDTPLYVDGCFAKADRNIWKGLTNTLYQVDFKYSSRSETLTNDFILLDMLDIQDRYNTGIFHHSIHDFHFCSIPAELSESGREEFSVELFWSLAFYLKHLGTTGVKTWDKQFSEFKDKVMDPTAEEFHIYMWDDEDDEPIQGPIRVELPEVCAKCCKPSKSRCARCKNIRYCSKECQMSDWKNSHKLNCHLPTVVYFEEEQSALVKKSKNIQDETFHERYFAEDGLECSECHVIQDYFSFSKSQIVKEELRRCKDCVANTAPPPPKPSELLCNGCHIIKDSGEFSKSQRANKASKRKCLECVEADRIAKAQQPAWYEGREHIFDNQ